MNKNKIELLSPAKDLECGMAAVDCGADAVYIGGPSFGARAATSNTIEDIEKLIAYAHRYWVKIYVTLNTILRDDELPAAVDLIREYHRIGVDGVIIQDMGLLACDIPPIPLIASTQMNNVTPEHVAFLEKTGFQRAVLARELSLNDIRGIHTAAPGIELESFIHGALCVCYSGQCYMSYSMGGRSANRGECAQPCRKWYTVQDTGGKKVAEGYLLSLADLNLSEHIGPMIDCGVTSFKIEGRLKDKNYVANVTAYYRNAIDRVLAEKKISRSSSGISHTDFIPDTAKTFNRGYSEYYINGKRGRVGSIQTPKMAGEKIGTVTDIIRNSIVIEAASPLNTGDGISFFDSAGKLSGTTVDGVNGKLIRVGNTEEIKRGTIIYRNRDHAFITKLGKSRNIRAVDVSMRLYRTDSGLALEVIDADGITASYTWEGALLPAEKQEQALTQLRTQLMKTGGSMFHCTSVSIDLSPTVYFLPASTTNAIRRNALELLIKERELHRPKIERTRTDNSEPYPIKELSYLGNIFNSKAKDFYQRHGVTAVTPAAETGLNMEGRIVMKTRYCLRFQLGMCSGTNGQNDQLTLIDEDGRSFNLEFDCTRCGMNISKGKQKAG
ncbi:MAG: U32 family peptidase [Spirochaetes bacterium]|nr:U32 family peptidase [Spirochaetota bacterium]